MRWPETQLRYLSQVPITNGLGEAGDKGNPIDWPRYIRTTDINDLLTLHEDRRVTLPIAKAEAALVKKDDILMTAAGATVGKSFQYCQAEPACYAGYLVRWRPDTKFAFPRFMAYWTDSKHFYDQIATGTVKSTIENFSASKYRSMRAPMPSLDEQETIADYLDRETQKIDELIAEQRGLIETLRERRQAGIDAEFEKLPELRIKLRRYIKFLTSGSRGWGDYYAGSGDTFVRIGNLPRSGLELGGERKFVALPPEVHEGQRTILETGDLLFSITAYIGSVAVVNGDWEGGYVSQHVALCRLDRAVLNAKFVGYFALSDEGRHQLSEGAVGGTKVQLALDDIKSLRVPHVPLDLQGRIVTYLDEQLSRIDELISESEDLIALSQERRAALITAAVTGQIDVGEAS